MTDADAPRAGGRLDEMKAEADHARQRYDLYKARTYGSRATSPERLRQLKRDSERASSTFDRARADA
jgi:hypothetical protein